MAQEGALDAHSGSASQQEPSADSLRRYADCGAPRRATPGRKLNAARKKKTMRVIFFVAVFGLIASAVVHLSTFLGINPQRVFPPVWVLHALIFVVWIPVVFSCRKIVKKENRKDFWKIATRNAPRWMKFLSVALFVYAFFNFFFTGFVLSEGGVPSELDGRKVIHNHGKVIRELSDEEYEMHQAYTVRGFSGHWMIFYAVGMMVLYSKMKEDSNEAVEAAS